MSAPLQAYVPAIEADLEPLVAARDALTAEIDRRRDAALAAEGYISGSEAEQLPVGSVVRWYRDRSDLGLRRKVARRRWTPHLDTFGKGRIYLLVHDATVESLEFVAHPATGEAL